METPLTPLEFARRARKLYPDRVAVVDGTHADLCAVFRSMRSLVGRFADNLESARAIASPISRPTLMRSSNRSMPCRKSAPCWCRLNYRLTADDFVYLINHSGSRIVCAHRDYLEAIDSIRSQLPNVEHFVALTG